MQHLNRVCVFLLLIGCAIYNPASASRAVGGELTFIAITSSKNYEVNLTIYYNCAARSTLLNNYTVSYQSISCGLQGTLIVSKFSEKDVSPSCRSQKNTCDGGTAFGFKKAVYKGIFSPPQACTDWKLSWVECNRNAEITTIVNPNNECLYLEALLNNYDAPGNNSPQFTTDPVSILCVGETSNINYNIYSIDGNRLVVSFITPKTGPTTTVNYKPGFSAANPITSSPAITFSSNGDLKITPTIEGEQSITAILVEQYNTKNKLVGSTIRDVQFIVVDCKNTLPTLSGFNGTNSYTESLVPTCAEQEHCFYLEGSDIDTKDKDVFITVNATLSRMTTYDANYDQNVVYRNRGNPNRIGICWKPYKVEVGIRKFSVTISDSSCPIIGSQTYLYTINVNPALNLALSDHYKQINCTERITVLSTVTGGVAPYSYKWSSGENTSSLTKDAGKYVLTVTDFKGCTVMDSVTLDGGLTPAFNYLDVCFGGTNRFYDTSSSASVIVSRIWDFGDGITGSGKYVTHTYASTGVYVVKLTVTNASGCIMTVSKVVRVCNQPLLKISIVSDSCVIQNSDNRCPQQTLIKLDSIFNGTNTCRIIKGVHWDFGDIGIDTAYSQDIFVTHGVTYEIAGVYTITATVFIDNCDPLIIKRKVNILESPVASLSVYSYYHKCNAPTEIYATLSSSANKPMAYEWFKGRASSIGVTDSLLNITASGLYTIKITNSLGCSKLLCTTSMYPLTVNFKPNDFCLKTSNIVMNNISENYWPLSITSWNFGDGTTSTAFNPNHQYVYDSVFVSRLTMEDVTGCSDSTYRIIKTYLPYDTLQIVSGLYSCFSEKILIQGPIGKSIEQYMWNFGAGEFIGTTTGYAANNDRDKQVQEGNPPLNITYQYILNANEGYYLPLIAGYKKIGLTVRYNNSCFKDYYDDVNVYKQLKVTGNVVGQRCIGNVLTFNGSVLKSGDYPISQWNLSLFRNPLVKLQPYVDTTKSGLPFSIAGQSFTFKYQEQDDYLLRVRVADSSPDHVCYADTSINASVNNIKAPDFTFMNSCVNTQVPLVNVEIKDIYETQDSTYFDFGEPGDTIVPIYGKLTNGITKVYKDTGTYRVMVKALNFKYGCVDSLIKYHQIYGLPKANVEYLLPCEGITTQLENRSQPAEPGQTIVKSEWVIEGDTIRNRMQNTSHLYNKSGTYSIKLEVEDTIGCKGSIEKDLIIYQSPIANFSVDDDSLLFAYKDIHFSDQSSSGSGGSFISSWVWSFGDGDSSSIQNPVHVYNNVDIFKARLIVSNQFGCIDDTVHNVDLNPYLILPTAFSPNGDAMNNELFLIYKGVKYIDNFKIFNRWGELVFDAKNDLNARWDGKFRHELQPPGVYQYYVTGQSIYGKDMKPLYGNILLKH